MSIDSREFGNYYGTQLPKSGGGPRFFAKRQRGGGRGGAIAAIILAVVAVVVVAVAVMYAVKRPTFAYTRDGAYMMIKPPTNQSHTKASPMTINTDAVLQGVQLPDDNSGIAAREMLLTRYQAMSDDATPALPDTTIHGRTVEEVIDTVITRPDAVLPPLNSLRRNCDLLRGNFADYDRLKWLLYSKEMKNVLPWLPLNMPEIPREGIDYDDEERSAFVFSTQPTIVSRN